LSRLVEEGALAPVSKPGEGIIDLFCGFETGLRPSSTSGESSASVLSRLVEEGALAPVSKPGEGIIDLFCGFETGLRPSSTIG
jgi:hypothetical protein